MPAIKVTLPLRSVNRKAMPKGKKTGCQHHYWQSKPIKASNMSVLNQKLFLHQRPKYIKKAYPKSLKFLKALTDELKPG
jgi:hypothetical protein